MIVVGQWKHKENALGISRCLYTKYTFPGVGVYVYVYVFMKYHDTNTQHVVYLLHAATSAYALPSYTLHIHHT